MIFTVENTIDIGRHATVVDAEGNKIHNVARYDTETKEVDVNLEAGSRRPSGRIFAVGPDGECLVARGHAPGSKILLDEVEYK